MDERYKRHGDFSWSELMTRDVAAAKEFYGKLFGWEFTEMPIESGMMAGQNYTVVKTGGAEVAGMMPMPPQAGNAPPAWGSYVTVDDVDATFEQAKRLGATIVVPPTDIPKVGRFFVFQDPEGAYLSAITYSMEG